MGDLDDMAVIVTGAARGIGYCIAETLARHGARVALADILEDQPRSSAEQLVDRGYEAIGVPVDIGSFESAEAMVQRVANRFGRVDGLVNNAGLDAPKGRPWEIDEAHWRRVIDIDLTGAWLCTRALLPRMVEQRQGRIVFISSVAARQAGSAHTSPAYAAAKAGLVGLTIALSGQLEPYGILVNAITPGPTGSTGEPFSDAGRQAYLSGHPLGFGGPQPIADGAKYLLSSSGNWLSGAVLNISGGELRGM
jgi:NAD(P)-dependent dehydrogenase (short-subunit alcohol dehydrogenase family)